MSARTKFTRKVVVGFLFAVFLLSSAEAQVPQDLLRLFNSLNKLQPQQQFQQPKPPAPTTFPQIGLGGLANISSTKPTIDCSQTQSTLAIILCSDENAARADWDVNASAWAYAAGLEEVARKAFWQSHDEWVQSLSRQCQLTAQLSRSQRDCVISTYRVRANALRSKLTGDALAEAKLSPEQRADIQARLASMGFLADEPDGEFGPNTRAAIRKFQQVNGFEEGAFLTAQQREILLGSDPAVRSQAQTLDARPRQSESESHPQVPETSGQSETARSASPPNASAAAQEPSSAFAGSAGDLFANYVRSHGGCKRVLTHCNSE